MNKFIEAIIVSCGICSQAFALNPEPGLYGGVILGGTFAKKTTTNITNPITNNNVVSTLDYSGFGNFGGQIGYRINDFRVELEGLYNHAPYDKITFTTANETFILKSKQIANTLTMKGNTDLITGMVNAYFDFFPFVGSQSNFVPYIGGGAGYANVRNKIKLYQGKNVISGSNVSENKGTFIAQAIAGASYFLDDFTTISVDYRFLSTGRVSPFNNRTQINSINLLFNGAFDFG